MFQTRLPDTWSDVAVCHHLHHQRPLPHQHRLTTLLSLVRWSLSLRAGLSLYTLVSLSMHWSLSLRAGLSPTLVSLVHCCLTCTGVSGVLVHDVHCCLTCTGVWRALVSDVHCCLSCADVCWCLCSSEGWSRGASPPAAQGGHCGPEGGPLATRPPGRLIKYVWRRRRDRAFVYSRRIHTLVLMDFRRGKQTLNASSGGLYECTQWSDPRTPQSRT